MAELPGKSQAVQRHWQKDAAEGEPQWVCEPDWEVEPPQPAKPLGPVHDEDQVPAQGQAMINELNISILLFDFICITLPPVHGLVITKTKFSYTYRYSSTCKLKY